MSPAAHLSAPVAGGLAVAALAATLAGTTAYQAGTVRVFVKENRPGGERVRLVVPAILINWGIKLVPEASLRDLPSDVRPWLPAIRIASTELARCPDGPLIELQEQRERVSIAKRNGALVIDVDSEDETVHVSVPLQTLAVVARELESAGPVR